MRIISSLALILSMSLLTACQHFDPMDTVRQEKMLNLAMVNSDTYTLIRNAHCTITTDTNDSIDTQLNPDAILLTTDYKTLSIECRAPGYKQKALAITNSVGQWSASDLFMLPPGDVVDTSSRLLPYYPSHILVLMNKKPFTKPNQIEQQFEKAKIEDKLYQGTT